MADTRLRPEWTHVDDIVAEGARWLNDDVQPPGAVMTHHGRTAHAGGGLNICFAPNGRLAGTHATREQGRDAVIVFDIGYALDVHDFEPGDFDTYRPAPFTADEFAACRDVLAAHGLDVVDEWNGPGCTTGSFALASASVAATLNATVATYIAGCPVHKTVFCGRGGEQGCTWSDDGLAGAHLVEPHFIEIDKPGLPEPAPSIGNRNLEAVLAAIERNAAVVEQIGVHAALVVPGRRGRVEDDEYVDEEGLGVTVPAEVYDRLVRLAVLADALGTAT